MTATVASGPRINFAFHGIGEPTRGLEPSEAAVWISVDRFETILDQVKDRKDVTLTFDDGNISDIKYGLPALLSRGLSATFFLVAGRLGQATFLAEQDVKDLVSAGMEVGCHGMRHHSWRTLTDEELREELLVARSALEQAAGCPITTAACPFGAYDRRVLGALRAYGYKHVFTSDDGRAGPGEWLQPRNTITARTSENTVNYVLAQEKLIPRTIRSAKLVVKRWR